ncbi:growth hormone secretagogue receptor type 1 [Microcaecilia unicolor]|uniref:Growth hormone secretagogue receptor type 1 n=1 Tax=Microcaecilia unicolor TaxID=1415580 RepID=A0A6P7ZAW8_9AMPH|nr:growth hormone secretagogue receptor type 1 [Microcaecilia unicolor]
MDLDKQLQSLKRLDKTMSNESASPVDPQNFTLEYVDYNNYSTPSYPFQLYPGPVVTGITITCIFLFIIGIVGNLMTVLVVYKFKDMRTTTNLYLSSMAFSDLLIFFCMPLDLFRLWQYRPWNFGDLLCKLFQFISESCTYATILNITALSVERYFAICFPLKAKVVITKGRVKLIILGLWVVSFVSAGPIFVLIGVEHENGTNPLDTNECRITEFAIRSGLLTIMVWTSSIFFFLPVFCLTVLYSLIGRKLWKRKTETIGPNTSGRDKNNRQTVKMLAVVVFAFILCWLPFHVGRYLFTKSFEAGSLEITLMSQYCNFVSFVLFYLSAAINPILYNIMSKKYRVAACRLFKLRHITRKTAYHTKDESSPGWTETSVST